MLSTNDDALIQLFKESGIELTECVLSAQHTCPYTVYGPSHVPIKYGECGWDSLKHMVLVSSLEDKFDIVIDIEDIVKIDSYNAARTILEKYGVKFDA